MQLACNYCAADFQQKLFLGRELLHEGRTYNSPALVFCGLTCEDNFFENAKNTQNSCCMLYSVAIPMPRDRAGNDVARGGFGIGA